MYREHIPSDQSEKVSRTDRFQAGGLHVQSLYGALRVEVTSENHVEVTVTGSTQERIDRVKIRKNSNTIDLEDPGSNKGTISNIAVGNISITGSVVGGMVISGDSVVYIDGKRVTGGVIAERDDVEVLVRVPQGSSISIQNLYGSADIGDIRGPLAARITSTANVTCGRMGDTNLSLQGGGEFNILEVNGSLTAQIMGSCDVLVRGGEVTTLVAQLMGSGDFRFDGSADTASLSVMGSGDIRVKRVKSKPLKQILGSGDIRVG